MKMDTSKWTDINGKIKIEPTRNKFYKKYLTKLVYYIPYSNCIDSADYNQLTLTRNFGRCVFRDLAPSRIMPKSMELHHERLKHLLDQILELRQYGRSRIEKSYVSMFASEDQLYNLATNGMKIFADDLYSVSVPRNDYEQDLLEQDYILLKQDNGFQYRVNIRSGAYSNKQNLQHLLTYLVNLGDQVGVNKGLKQEIARNYKYLSGGYFYINDLKLLDMIRLIDPTFVKSFQKIKVIQ